MIPFLPLQATAFCLPFLVSDSPHVCATLLCGDHACRVQVKWDNETECFSSLTDELSEFYCVQPPLKKRKTKSSEAGASPAVAEGEASSAADKGDASAIPQEPSDAERKKQGEEAHADEDEVAKAQWRWDVEHVIFPAMRSYLMPPRQFADNGVVLQVANLSDLYKVFERC